MNIGFTTDTNMLKKMQNDLYNEDTIFDSLEIFTDYTKSLNNHTSSKDKLWYYLPEIVIKELIQQKVIAYNDRFDSLIEQYKNIEYGLVGELPKNGINQFIEKEKEKYLKNIEVLKLNTSKKLFDKVLEDAINKIPPFDKTLYGNKSDSGFKDYLIWQTVLLNTEIDKCDKFYFCSSDKVFYDNMNVLTEQFSKKHPDVNFEILYYEPDGSQRQNCLQKIISDNKLYETDKIKLYDEQLILKYIKNIEYAINDTVYYISNEQKIFVERIIFDKFEDEDFYIDNVDCAENVYKVFVKFKTSKYDINRKFKKDDSKYIYGNILFQFKKEKNDFNYIDYDVTNVRFRDIVDIFASISETINKFYTTRYSKMLESISKAVENINNMNSKKETISDSVKRMCEINMKLAEKSIKSLDYEDTDD